MTLSSEQIEATFAPLSPSECEKKVRDEIVEGVRQANLSIKIGEFLDPTFWEKTDWMNWQLVRGAKPSAAIRRVFDPKAHSEMECLSVMSAVYYRAILKVCGSEKKFDKIFANNMEISTRSPVLDRYIKYEAVSATIHRGDWVYFYGHPYYDHPYMEKVLGEGWGDWRGENAVFVGDKNGDKMYSGLGITEIKRQEMSKRLLGGYNAKVRQYNARLKDHNAEAEKKGMSPLPRIPDGTLEEMLGMDRILHKSPKFALMCKGH
jgi:hypothetical protein